MIYIDIDGVLVDFYGTAKKFGIQLKINEFGKWRWGADGYPAAEEFYEAAEPQPWAGRLIIDIDETTDCGIRFMTKDYGLLKRNWLRTLSLPFASEVFETPGGKAAFCKHPLDLLIDDNPQECDAWRNKGGIAYWLNLAEDDPFGKFLEWWGLGK
jgi:hypothetical protein